MKRIKIRTALITLSALFFILVLSLISVSYYFNWKKFQKEYYTNLEFRTDLFLANVQSSFVNGDFQAVLQKSDQLLKQDDVVAVNIDLSNHDEVVNISKMHSKLETRLISRQIRIESSWIPKDQIQPLGILSIRFDQSRFNQITRETFINGVSGSFFLMCLIGLALQFYSRKITRHILLLSNILKSGRLHEISSIVVDSDIEEITTLQTSVKEMATKIEHMNRSESENAKSAAVGRISSQLTHDMRAPIGTFERLLTTNDEDIPQLKPAIRESVNRLYTMVEALRHGEVENIIRKKDYTLDFDFGFESLIGKANDRSIHFKVPEEEIESVLLDLPKVERSWINLASNALEFSNSFVIVETEVSGTDLFIRVIDDGPGIPEDFLPRLFQRGATHGKEDGTGLGLAYVRQIMRGHGGDVSYKREDGMTIFECYLPKVLAVKSPEELEKLEEKGDLRKAEDLKTPSIIEVSICFESEDLNQRVYDRLMAIRQDSYNFAIGFHKKADIVITDSEEISDEVVENKKRLLMFDPSMSHDEIVRRAPLRLGIRSGSCRYSAIEKSS